VAGQSFGWLPVTRLTDERPKAPWHPFPLVELCVLAGIVLIVLGLLSFDTDRGRAMLLCGMALGSLGGFDTAAREHFAGYKSHSMMLAGVPAVGLAAILYFAGAPWPAVVAGALIAFAGAILLLARAYERRAG
jgi:cell division protein FtsW (lipid II flippase)